MKDRVSTPTATGGAGTYFEQHTNAALLALLLVKGVPPILTDCRVVEVNLQTEHLGWNTDDFLMVAETGTGQRKRLVGQVKRSFSVSYGDEDFKEAILDAWRDYQSKSVFNVRSDRFVLVTFQGTNMVLRHFTALLDTARASETGTDFGSRLSAPGFLHSKVRAYCDEVRKIVDEAAGQPVLVDDLREFLSLLYLLSLDLNSGTAQTEAWIKSLLAHTTGEDDPVGAASDTWNSLLQLIGFGNPQAIKYRRDDLPEVLRKRHSPVTAADDRALESLRQNTCFVLDGIRDVIGDSIHLQRTELEARLFAEVEESQVVLVTGEAGSGKSGVAKAAVEKLMSAGFVFAFRAEQFAATHIDATLNAIHPGLNAGKIQSLLATHDRKVLLIESVERLLEAAVRSAFTDLMTMILKDRSWRLLMTCRDYSADLVRSTFLETVGPSHSVVSIPRLTDAELALIRTSCPQLDRPLSSQPLSRLLSNPYFLDMAARMRWSDGKPLPENERSLRKKFWREVIRDESHGADALPHRRGEAFLEVALRRARALTAFARCDDLDVVAIKSLKTNSLLRTSPKSEELAAPSHDVLEDWALTEWVDRQFVLVGESLAALSPVLGTYPAIRRTYKRWLEEHIAIEVGAADLLFDEAIEGHSLPAHFVDDTLVSLLRSPVAATLIKRRSELLFVDRGRLMLRVMHLLRVGCITTPDWAGSSPALASLICAPAGTAWSAALGEIHLHFTEFAETDHEQLRGFLGQWSQGVSWQTPYPDGAADAAAIVLLLLPYFDDYRDDRRDSLVSILAKIPLAAREHVSELLKGKTNSELEQQVGDEFRELVLTNVDGMPVCRDMPQEVIASARQQLLLEEDDEEDFFGPSSEIEPLFGIRAHHFDFFPASAFRGPFFFLLRSHPEIGLRFVVELLNHTSAIYAQRSPVRYVAPPRKITLRFGDGTSRDQWASDRLWNMYRGTSVTPLALQSALMALERWLLDTCEITPTSVDAILIRLLRESETAAITSVVASVVTAYPRLAAEAGLVLLRSPACIYLDRLRTSHEAQSPSRVLSQFPRLDASKKIFDQERKDSDSLPHRRKDLEFAALNLQCGPAADRVQLVLDEHRASLPPLNEQDDDDRRWRLALDRMDLRRYRPKPDQSPGDVAQVAEVDAQSTTVVVELQPPDQDVQEMVDRANVRLADVSVNLGMQSWAYGVFTRDPEFAARHDEWRRHLVTASSRTDLVDEDFGGIDQALSARAYVAAVCVRDHWNELTAEQQEWCVTTICDAIAAKCDATSDRQQRFAFSGDRAAAAAIPRLCVEQLASHLQRRVREGFAQALTHAIDEVVDYAAYGVGDQLWDKAPEFATRCCNVLAFQANLLQAASDVDRQLSSNKQRGFEVLAEECRLRARQLLMDGSQISASAYLDFDATRWIGSRAFLRILTMAHRAPHTEIAKRLFCRAAETLQAWWHLDDPRRNRDADVRPRDVEPGIATLLERFIIHLTPNEAVKIIEPILDDVERNPREASLFLRGVVSAENSAYQPETFWAVWDQFASRVRNSRICNRIDDPRYSHGDEMISAIFLGNWWKENVGHWRSLDGYVDRIHSLFMALPPSATVLDDYVRFLYQIGRASLPAAFVQISQRIQEAASVRMLSKPNTTFMLESLLRRHVYGAPLDSKRDPHVREAILQLLDQLVEAGSSAAYRMRDDFVTPVPNGD